MYIQYYAEVSYNSFNNFNILFIYVTILRLFCF